MTRGFQKSAVSRADLVRLVASLPDARVIAVAKELGFDHIVRELDPTISTEWINWDELGLNAEALPDELAPMVGRTSQRHGEHVASVSLPLWRVEQMEFHDDEPREVVEVQPEGLTEDDWTSPGQALFATPKPTPLAPWSRLWPALRQALQSTLPSREADVSAYVRSLARGDVVVEVPRAKRIAWSSRFSVWIDRSARLGPFWSDQDDLRRRLRRLGGRQTAAIRWLDPGTQAQSVMQRGDVLQGFRVDVGVPVLVVGDLGVFGTAADRSVWRRTGRRLLRDDVRLSALVPCSSGRWSADMRNLWNAIPWERGRSRNAGHAWNARAEQLLQWLSPVAHAEPGLLRAIRLLLPPSEADASTEADVWNHEDVLAADATGWILKPEAAKKWRARFAAEVDDAMQKRVRDLIRTWHEHLPHEVLRAETLAWFGLDTRVEPPGDVTDALDFVRRLEASTSAVNVPGFVSGATKRFNRQLLAGMPAKVYEKVPALKKVWVASFQGEPVPNGVDMNIEALRAEIERPGELRFWSLRQVGTDMEFSLNARGSAWPSYVDEPGSPVACLVAARPWVTVVQGETQTPLSLEGGLSMQWDPDKPVELRTDRCTVKLVPWQLQDEPGWVAAGRDCFGLWADAEICRITQRFRWIPPGKFLMGSPKNEAGRFEDEGPQHEVLCPQGRWLGDTPVTQALWKAVMGDNPSWFQSDKHATDDRPVEQVSWDECVAFVQRSGLRDVRLPSEVEWEYACRAGTRTATWVGDLQIRGENDAPELNAIAWYGGNCGVEYDLDKGYDATNWPNKQHAFSQGGTRAVGKKDPNPFGLYDMLGNVYEWCSDVYALYSNDTATRGERVLRVIRGGSWLCLAGNVRAALRSARDPGDRFDYLGFRLARGPAPSQASRQATEAERSEGRRSGGKAEPADARRAELASDVPGVVETDSERGKQEEQPVLRRVWSWMVGGKQQTAPARNERAPKRKK